VRTLLVFVLLASSATAYAHGRFPESYQLVQHPSDPDTMALVTTFALVVTRDGGATWRWICRDVTEAALTEDPRFTYLDDGALLGGTFDGLLRGTDAACTWGFPDDDLTRQVVIDVLRDPADPSRAYALTSSGGEVNELWASDDGVTWAPTGEPIDRILFERVLVAPSRPQRIYLSGTFPRVVDNPVRRPFVYRSDDSGETWEQIAFEFQDRERNVMLLAVDPEDPDRLLMKVKHDEDFPDVPDRLVLSEDGGDSWVTVLEVPDLRDALIHDGAMWAGGRRTGTPDVLYVDGGAPTEERERGLWRSEDGGETWQHLQPDLSVGCLAWRRGELWMCGQNFDDDFALGRSADGGETVEAAFRFDELQGPSECGEGSDVALACVEQNEDIIFDLFLPIDAGLGDCLERGGITICRDAGTADASVMGGGGDGCSCNAPGRDARAPFGVLALALLIGGIGRRARAGNGVA